MVAIEELRRIRRPRAGVRIVAAVAAAVALVLMLIGALHGA